MATHPANLAARFLLELAALYALSYWGWTQHTGVVRWLWTVGLPLVAALLWYTFNVPDDSSRSGQAPIPVPGWLRLVLELALFAASTAALYAANRPAWAMVFLVIVVIHYALSYDRIQWLLAQKKSSINTEKPQ